MVFRVELVAADMLFVDKFQHTFALWNFNFSAVWFDVEFFSSSAENLRFFSHLDNGISVFLF